MRQFLRSHRIFYIIICKVVLLPNLSPGGYLIPANTMVIPFLYSIHMNEEAHQEPHRFDPGRFLQDKLPTQFMPFQVGEFFPRVLTLLTSLYIFTFCLIRLQLIYEPIFFSSIFTFLPPKAESKTYRRASEGESLRIPP